MRIFLLCVFFTFFALILETPAQTGSPEITPDTRLCWYRPATQRDVIGKLPPPKNVRDDCYFYATCNEVLSWDRRGNSIRIPPSHRGYRNVHEILFNDCRDYGAGKNRKPDPVTLGTSNVGKFTEIRGGEVYVKKPGARNWTPVAPGDAIFPGMSIRTGSSGRVRFVYYDETLKGARGNRTELNLGPNTAIRVEKREDLYDGKGVIGLMNGLLRVTTKATKGAFWILIRRPKGTPRTSNWGVGIRGTAIAITRDPNTDTTEVFLDHGDAFVEYGIRKVNIEPRTSLRIVKDRIGKPRRMDQSIWNDMVAQTDAQDEDADLDFFGPDEPDMPADLDASVGGSNDRWAAREMVNILLTSMKNNDQSTFLDVTGGIMRSVYLREIEKRGSLKAMLDRSGQRPASWKHECSICTNGGRSCMASVNITTARTGKVSKFIFTFENYKVTDGPPAQGETLRKFQAMKPVCGEND